MNIYSAYFTVFKCIFYAVLTYCDKNIAKNRFFDLLGYIWRFKMPKIKASKAQILAKYCSEFNFLKSDGDILLCKFCGTKVGYEIKAPNCSTFKN